MPTALPGGSGSVTYNYTVWDVAGQTISLDNVTVTDDKCNPVILNSSDLNGNGKLDPGENWKYSCTAILSKTTTNTAIATGYSDDAYHQAATASVIATVFVGARVVGQVLGVSTSNVSVPSLPNTGFPPEERSTPWNAIALSGILALVSVSIVVALRTTHELILATCF